jgi:tight adherence protein C
MVAEPIYFVIGFLVLGITSLIVIVVRIIGARRNRPSTIEDRLLEFGARERPLTLEEIELSRPMGERVLAFLVNNIARPVKHFMTEKRKKVIQHRVDLAGNPYTLDGFLIRHVLLMTLLLGLGIALFFMLGSLPVEQRVLMLVTGAGLAYHLPMLLLERRIVKRKQDIVTTLPDVVDWMLIYIEAGLGFDVAMARVSEKLNNELSPEFSQVILALKLGKLRREALHNMADRLEIPEVSAFVAVLVQADQLGVSIPKVLRIQSEQMHVRRRQRIQEAIGNAEVWRSVCLNVLLNPSITLWLLAPLIAKMMG